MAQTMQPGAYDGKGWLYENHIKSIKLRFDCFYLIK